MVLAASPLIAQAFAYGDSLTAGVYHFQRQFPYAPYLEKKLRETAKPGEVFTVQHRGLPGWTTGQMLNVMDDEAKGLLSAIRDIESLSVVVILSGTNDLGYKEEAETIVDNLLKLHSECHAAGVPYTIAIAVPPSSYQSRDSVAAEKASYVNEKLREHCEKNPKMTFHPFPFPFEASGDNWDSDGLHFSEKGYILLGESLADPVRSLVDT